MQEPRNAHHGSVSGRGGGGQAVVLVHSSASSSRQWRALTSRLSDRFNVIALDLCGYAAPSDAPETYSFEDDLSLVRRAVLAEESPVYLVGHSYGGLLAAKTAIDHPRSIRSLTLIEPVCFHLLEEAGERESFAEITAVKERQVAAVASGDLMRSAKGFTTYWMGAETWTAMPDERRMAIARTMPKVASEWMGGFRPTTRLNDYASFQWPTMLVRASDTTLAAYRVVELIRRQIGDCRFVEIAEGGHMSPVTNGKPVNVAIEQFLTAT